MAEEDGTTLEVEEGVTLDTQEPDESPKERPLPKREQIIRDMKARNAPEPESAVQDTSPAPEPEPPVYLKDGVWHTKRKVNGEEEEVPFETVLTASQKLQAGDERLREAAEKQKELERERRELAEAQQRLDSMAKDLEVRYAPKQEDPKELAKQYHELLLNEDPSDPEVQEKLDELLVKMNTKPAAVVPPDQVIDEKVEAKLQQRRVDSWNIQLKAADAWAAETHKDVWEDDVLKTVASREAQKIMGEKIAQGQKVNAGFSQLDVDPKMVYEKAVSRTKDWLKSQTAGATQTDGRVERKRSAGVKTATGNGATAQLDAPPKPKTQAEKVAEMRRARGLQR